MCQIAAYVRSVSGEPLAPMHSYPRVKRFLNTGKAKIVSHKPYIIQLTYDIGTEVEPYAHLGVDTGRTNLGLTSIRDDGTVEHSVHVTTSNKDVTKHMEDRKVHRHASRRGERKVRQRRAIKNGTIFLEGKSRERLLPQCEIPITNNYIANSEARFANRKRPEGWLTPTASHLLNTILKSIDMQCKLVPIKDITVEISKWNFAKMDNPDIKNWEYQKGVLYGYDSVEDTVYDMQGGHCLMCKNEIEHCHHIIPKHLGGSDTIENRAGLCTKCHTKIHTDSEFMNKLKTKKEGQLKKYGALSVMNQITPFLLDALIETYPDKDIYVTTGWQTAQLRNELGLPKDHHLDAWCIAASRIAIENLSDNVIKEVSKLNSFEVKQFRRQDRAIIHYQTERTYKYNGQIVAKNRHKRFEQKEPSLEDWFQEQINLHGIKKAEHMRSNLTVKKSTRGYNNLNRIMAGSVFLYNGKRYVLSGQRTNGQYYLAVGDTKTNYPAKKCNIISNNTGLVYL